jgi:hypothetical protein
MSSALTFTQTCHAEAWALEIELNCCRCAFMCPCRSWLVSPANTIMAPCHKRTLYPANLPELVDDDDDI